VGWFTTRRDIAEIRQQLKAMAQALHQASQPPSIDINQVLAGLLDSQVKQVSGTGDFIRMIHEIATERMASALGRKGGRRRAATAMRDERGRMLKASSSKRASSDCILCADPSTAQFSAQDFEAHQGHKNRVVREPIRPTPEEAEIIEAQEVEVRTQPEYPLPVVVRPGANFSNGDQASGASGSSESGRHQHASERNGVE